MLDISQKNMRMLSHMGQRGAICAIALCELASDDDDIFALTADVSHLASLERFAERFPNRFLNVGISEQNMIGVASGLAFEGSNVFATTYATFLTMRSFEQIRHNLGYQKANVKLIGFSAGLAMGMSGNTHYALEDIAIMRSIPNMIVLSPADPVEAYQMAYAMAKHTGPVYIRLTGNLNQKIIASENEKYVWCKGREIVEGEDIAIIATGAMVSEACEASKILLEKGIRASVVNMSCIKPLDEELVEQYLEKKLIVTVEEHNIIGGLGGAISEFLCKFDRHPRLVRMGINDTFIHPGTYEYLLMQYGLKAEDIAKRVAKEAAESGIC